MSPTHDQGEGVMQVNAPGLGILEAHLDLNMKYIYN